jgi:hypothetical protein
MHARSLETLTSSCATPTKTLTGKRRLLIGRTDGGRTLTLVIEQTLDPTTWLIVTGWDSSPRERKLLRS